MKITTLLDHIDSGHVALPEFQRGYVWNRDQVRGLFDSLYRRHPVGGLLTWATDSASATHRGDGKLAGGIVKLLLDGQQRMTSLYGVVRGRPPKFFDGNPQTFTGLYFHLDTQIFSFYQPIKMKEDPLWVDVTAVMKAGIDGIGRFASSLGNTPETAARQGEFIGRLARLLGILEIDLYVEDVTGADKTIDVVVDIFNRVNSGGTKLSQGDLALAIVCADWPEARGEMKARIAEWKSHDYHFTLDWLLRCMNTVITGEAKFQYLHDRPTSEIKSGLERATKHINTSLNMIGGRLGLDHDQVLFGRYGFPVMVRYLDKNPAPLAERERDKLLLWYVQAGMWGRFSGSTETAIDQDLATLEAGNNGLDALVNHLRLWHGGLRVEPEHFASSSLGSRFYPVLYLLTRMGEARDWGTGVPLKAKMLGKMNQLEVHHIFPKSRLYKRGFNRSEVNSLANYCFLTKDTNLEISDRLPEAYFLEVESNHPGALASQWIPMNPELWKIENYGRFLEARRELLAAELNRRMEDLLHGDLGWLAKPATQTPINLTAAGGISGEAEEAELDSFNGWMDSVGLPRGVVAYEYADATTGKQIAVFDLAWPNGVQEGLSQPATLLLNETPEVVAIASQAGFRCFLTTEELRRYVMTEVLVSGFGEGD